MRFPALADPIHEARSQARLNHRCQIVARDIQRALLDYRIPSDGALQQIFQATQNQHSAGIRLHRTQPVQLRCKTPAVVLQNDFPG